MLGELLTGSLHLSLLPSLGGLHQRGQGVGGGQEGVTHLKERQSRFSLAKVSDTHMVHHGPAQLPPEVPHLAGGLVQGSFQLGPPAPPLVTHVLRQQVLNILN